MTKNNVLEFLENVISHVTFVYNGKNCGVDPISREHYNLWYGNDYEVECKSIDEVKNGKYFDGKSLLEIFDDITDIDF